jgi:hypothetical protein
LIGDFLAFLAASSMVERYVEIKDNNTNDIIEFKNVTCVKKEFPQFVLNPDQYTLTDCQRLKKNHLSAAKAIMISKVNKFKKATNCDTVLIVMGGPTNFRNDLPLFEKYKNRDGAFRPSCLKDVRNLLEQTYNTIYSEGCEADDLISMYQYKGFKTKERIVVVAVDKDAKQTPGLLYNPTSDLLQDCSGFGKIYLKQKASGLKKLDGYGRLFFYYQLVTGDPVDTYNPFPKGSTYTDLKFYNMFKDFTTDKECWSKIAELYKDAYGHLTEWTDWRGEVVKGTWQDILQCYVDVVHMRRFERR